MPNVPYRTYIACSYHIHTTKFEHKIQKLRILLPAGVKLILIPIYLWIEIIEVAQTFEPLEKCSPSLFVGIVGCMARELYLQSGVQNYYTAVWNFKIHFFLNFIVYIRKSFGNILKKPKWIVLFCISTTVVGASCGLFK